MNKHFLWKVYKIYLNNYLGQLARDNFWGAGTNYPGANFSRGSCLGGNCVGAIACGATVLGTIVLEAIIWRQLSKGVIVPEPLWNITENISLDENQKTFFK